MSQEQQADQSQKEIEHLREALRRSKEAGKERLRDCEAALSYYANFNHYGVTPRDSAGVIRQNAVKDDFYESSNDAKTLIAGKRAKTYFEKYEQE